MRCTAFRRRAHRPRRRAVVGSSIFVVFAGACSLTLEGETIDLATGDMVAVASWADWSFAADERCDLFRVSDAPVIEAFGLDRGKADDARAARRPRRPYLDVRRADDRR